MKPVVKLIALTQGAGELINKNAQEIISYVARVSNPNNQLNFETASGLIRYCIKNKHVSIFEHSYMTLEINTTRAIAAQILRHRSFCYQEFCLDGDSKITISNEKGTIQRIPIRELYQKWNKKTFKTRYARSYIPELNRFIDAPILSVYNSGEKDVYEYTISYKDSKKTIRCTREHKVLTKEKGFVQFIEAYQQNLTIALNGKVAEPIQYNQENLCGRTLAIGAKWGKITEEKYLGVRETYDIEMDHPTHNFVADGVVVHNSQRYMDTRVLTENIMVPELRRQDTKNRQNSIDDLDEDLRQSLVEDIENHFKQGQDLYNKLLDNGVAKESSRFVLPLATPTRIYMTGNVRSWMTYIALREKNGTQKEHMEIAKECKNIFKEQFPDCYDALGGDEEWNI